MDVYLQYIEYENQSLVPGYVYLVSIHSFHISDTRFFEPQVYVLLFRKTCMHFFRGCFIPHHCASIYFHLKFSINRVSALPR
ncbi:hypothetical protein SAMN05216419_100337 [Nitrosomonas cryotolerans]|uniref:Uncharacterized protein n=1 Tax=Nitrosomonas cryotolerans ATCC 49181 TaxID=1131553 RepID=A0A1N6J7R1_9PROT|nr:hypothetical protein SAMN05216419_100337 [Nitrosomonas cryotolerans]SIO40408.1 hypothetical protein SAMN02743940_2381 [Nitrosomonas cryotolerans ATCC 49181]